MSTSPPTHNLQAAQQVFWHTLFFNLLVSFSKLFWGFQTHTLSITADGFHSLLDAVANVIGIIGLNIAKQPADQDHPYGHRKFEAIAAMMISFFIFLTCFEIVGESAQRFFSAQHSHPQVNSTSYLIIGCTLLINLLVSWYENRKGRELNNELLKADAKHTFSDCLVSISVIISLLLVQMGWWWADTVLALIVAGIILKVGFDLILVHWGALTDEAILNPADIRSQVLAVPGVLDCHKIRSRGMPDHIFIDLHIQVDPQLTVKEAHGISYAVEAQLEASFDGRVSEVLVHVEEFESVASPPSISELSTP